MRRLIAPAGFVLAAALVLAPVLTASAFPGGRASVAADPPPITWGVEPADADGDDDRASLAYAVDPGTQIDDYIAVSNFGDTATTFDLYATDATNDFETGAFGLLPSEEEPTDAGAWITVAQDTVTVEPGARAVVPFTMLVPSDASPGDHTGGVIASFTTSSTDADGQAINLEQRVAARVYLRVSGDPVAEVDPTGLVAGFSPSWNPFSGGEAGIDYAVANTGNMRIDVDQDVVLTGPFGIEFATLHLDPVINLLPGQSAHVRADASGIPPLLLMFAKVTLTPGEPTDTVADSAERKADGTPADPRPEVEYSAVNEETLTGAISWILLILAVVIGVLIWLGIRYVSVTRDRMYDAIDEATEQARLEAARESEIESDDAREKATVS